MVEGCPRLSSRPFSRAVTPLRQASGLPPPLAGEERGAHSFATAFAIAGPLMHGTRDKVQRKLTDGPMARPVWGC